MFHFKLSKKLLLSLALFCLVFTPFLRPQLVFAQNPPAAADPTQKIDFNTVDPLQIGGSSDVTKPAPSSQTFNTPGAIVSRVLVYAFPIAGIILFIMILWGGFEMVAGATETKSMEAGKQRITAAVIGFLLLFTAYWLTQIIDIVFNVKILG